MLDKQDVQETGSDCPWSNGALTVEKVATAKLPTKATASNQCSSMANVE